MTLKVYTLARTPDATDTVEWTSICHSRDRFIMIHYVPRRELSRWVSADRKRPFSVAFRSPNNVGWMDLSWHATYAAAQKAAVKAAMKWESQ